jgi:protein-tyrosine phosphatase
MKVLMVCLGNICRSPIAEGILKDKIKKYGLDWEVDSAGTSGFHDGELPDKRSIDAASKKGIDITYQRSRQLLKSDLENFDHIIVMDSQNYNQTITLAQEHQKDKVKLLMNFAFPNENRAVPDPYYSGGFDYVFEMIETAINAMIEEFMAVNK